jgi:hypothetical protein
MHSREDKYKLSVGKPEGKSQLGRPWRRWDSKVKVDHKEME